MLYSASLEEKVFDIPMHGGDEFVIISGYVGPEPIARLKELPHNVHTKLIFGMYGMSGISSELHKQILVLNKELENVEIYYSTIPVHSKIYFMRNNDGEIKNALVGSANFSVSGLRNDYREVLSDLDETSYGDLSDYYAIIEGNLVHCENADTTKIRQVARSFTFDEQEDELIQKGICRATMLVEEDGKTIVPEQSGINWGCAKKLSGSHVVPGDAYIRITTDMINKFPQLFPTKKYVNGQVNSSGKGKKTRQNDEIELIWDDGYVMKGLLEGSVPHKDGTVIPKQLASSPSKNILGKYLRSRMGIKDLEYVITKADMERYGRTSVDISLISEGVYYLDFSPLKHK